MSADTFSISLSGLELQRMKADAVAMNIANSSNIYRTASDVYKPLEVVSEMGSKSSVDGVVNAQTIERDVDAQRIYDPSHPYADENGFVFQAPVDTVQEMVSLMTSLRAYQANVQALEASKKIIQWAIESGAN